MKFTFDLFHGDQSPSKDFVGWVSKWWYRSVGLPIEKGVLPTGDEWLLVGWFLSEGSPSEIISKFRSTGVETLFEADGQFILVIYSKYDDTLYIYRDRTGTVPIVYAKGENGLAISLWASHVSDLAGIGKSVSTSFKQLPLYRVIIDSSTLLDGVNALSSRCSMRIRDKKITLDEHPMVPANEELFPTLQVASDVLGENLSRSVKKRVQNCNDIGAWLSGGNDSSLIVALLRRHYSRNIRTIFVTFEDYKQSYGDYARQIAKKYETDHIECILTLKEYLNLWAETIYSVQDPLNSPNTIGQAAALKMLAGSIGSILTGEGADTIFGGPYWTPLLLLSYMGGVMPGFLRRLIFNLSEKMNGTTYMTKIIAKGLRASGTPVRDYIHSENAFGMKKLVDPVFGSGTWQATITSLHPYIRSNMYSDLFVFLLLDYHPAHIAASRRLGYWHGLPDVYPFLDYELIQHSQRLPARLRYHFSTKKASLKLYAKDFFDTEFIYKPKEGFGVPLSTWFTRREFEPFLKLPLEERSLRRGWWNESELKKVIDLHIAGYGNDKTAESIPWIATNLELWARICLEGDSPGAYKVS